MLVIGIVGGVASGKSTVARLLGEHGAGVLDADRAGHEVLRLSRIEAAARERWGEEVFGPNGRIEREALARIVFAEEPDGLRERKYLEELTHPEIARRLKRQSELLAASGKAVAVLDAPLLLESAWDKLCEELIFVDAPVEARLTRAIGRGWSKEDFWARQRVQESLDRKRGRADVIIDNSGSPEQTRAQVEHYWQSRFG